MVFVQSDDDACVEAAVREPQHVVRGANAEVHAAGGEGLDSRTAAAEIQELHRYAFGFEQALIIRHPQRQQTFVHRCDAEFQHGLSACPRWQREAKYGRRKDGKPRKAKPTAGRQVVTH